MDRKTQVQLTIKQGEDFDLSPDQIQLALRQYLSQWWVAGIPGNSVTIDGISAEEPAGESGS